MTNLSNETILTEEDPTIDTEDSFDLMANNTVEPIEDKPTIEENIVTETKPEIKKDTPFFNPFLEVDESVLSNSDITQNLPNKIITNKDLNKCLKACDDLVKNKNIDDTIKKTIIEITNVLFRTSQTIYSKQYNDFFTNENKELKQVIDGDKGSQIKIGYPKLKLDDNVDVLSGQAALRYINKISKTGVVTKIPLWHSGIVLTIDPFSEQELLDLNIGLSRQKIELGIETRGISLSGDDVHIVGTIVDFILDHVIDCNLKAYNKTILADTILANDIHVLLAGALACIYPSGYPIFHPCVNVSKGLCNYNIESKHKENGDFYPDSLLDFTKIVWVDENSIGFTNKQHMSSGSKTHTLESITNYQNELINKLTEATKQKDISSITAKDGNVTIAIGFKVPTIRNYINQSNDWVNHIKKMVDSSLTSDLKLLDDDNDELDTKDKRTKLINSYSVVTEIVKHLAWVDYILITEANGIKRRIIDNKSIKASLEVFMKTDNFKKDFETALQKFKEESLIAFTGIPNFACPVCGSGQVTNSKTPSLIPINMIGYFFSTMEWRKLLKHQLG